MYVHAHFHLYPRLSLDIGPILDRYWIDIEPMKFWRKQQKNDFL